VEQHSRARGGDLAHLGRAREHDAIAGGDHGGALDRIRSWARTGDLAEGLLEPLAAWTGDERWIERLAPGWKATAPPEFRMPPAVALAAWRSGSPAGSLELCAGVITGAVHGLWGVIPDAFRESLAVEPALPAAWQEMALRQLRIGASMLDLELRRGRSGLRLSVRLRRGPAVRLVLTCPGAMEFDVDGEQLTGGRAVFRVEGEHNVTARA